LVGVDVQFFAESLARYDRQQKMVLGIIEKRPLGLLMVNATKLKQSLIPNIRRCLNVRVDWVQGAAESRTYSSTVVRATLCMVVSPTSKYDEPQVENVAKGRHFQPRVIIFECRTNDCTSSVLSYDQPLA